MFGESAWHIAARRGFADIIKILFEVRTRRPRAYPSVCVCVRDVCICECVCMGAWVRMCMCMCICVYECVLCLCMCVCLRQHRAFPDTMF